jgi:hypothetical protein
MSWTSFLLVMLLAFLAEIFFAAGVKWLAAVFLGGALVYLYLIYKSFRRNRT